MRTDDGISLRRHWREKVMQWYLVLAVFGAVFGSGICANFSICRESSGQEFYTDFYWWPWADPTDGQVKYVHRRSRQ